MNKWIRFLRFFLLYKTWFFSIVLQLVGAMCAIFNLPIICQVQEVSRCFIVVVYYTLFVWYYFEYHHWVFRIPIILDFFLLNNYLLTKHWESCYSFRSFQFKRQNYWITIVLSITKIITNKILKKDDVQLKFY